MNNQATPILIWHARVCMYGREMEMRGIYIDIFTLKQWLTVIEQTISRLVNLILS